LTWAASWILLLAFLASDPGGLSLVRAAQAASASEKLYVRAGKLVSLTEREAVLSAIGPDGLPQRITFAINAQFYPPPVKPGDAVIAMYAKRGSRKVLVILNGRKIQTSEPPAHPVENLGVAEVVAPQPLVAEVMREFPTIEARGPSLNAQGGGGVVSAAPSGSAAPASDGNVQSAGASDAGLTGGGGGGGGTRYPEGVVTSVRMLNAFDVEVDVRGLTTTMQFVVNFFTQVDGVLQKGAFVEVQFYKEGGRNIASYITVEPPPKHIAR
jgi:hypothetical protein